MYPKLNFDFSTNQKVIQKISFIDAFKGKWLVIEKEGDRYLKELRKIATIQSIGSSTRIEGATLTNEEINTLLSHLKIDNLENRDEQEVIGYYETLEVILDNYNEIELTESNIFNLHNLLLKFSRKDQNHKGRYKQLSNKVVATYPGGEKRIVSNTTEPFLVKKEMEHLIHWTNLEFEKKEIHPIIVIATFVYEFLSIHPFQDGNGRLSRLLTTLLLLKENYHFIQYVSFENQIEKRKKDYYKVLMDAQQHRNTEKEIINHWMIFFLECLEEMIKKLEVKYDQYKLRGSYLNPRQKEIFDFIKKNSPLKVGDLSTAFEEISIHTIKKDLRYFTEAMVCTQMGASSLTSLLQ